MKSKIIIKNFLTKVISSAATIVLGFIATPLLLKFLGKEDFALFKLASDWLTGISFFDTAFTIGIFSIFAKSKKQNLAQNTWGIFRKYIFFPPILVLIGIAFTPFLPQLFKIPDQKVFHVQLAFAIGCLNFLLLEFTGIYAWYEYQEKSYLVTRARIVQNIIFSVLSIVFAYLAFGVVGQFLSMTIAYFSIAFYIAYLFFKINKGEINYHDTEIRLEEKMNQLSTVFRGVMISIFNKISFLSDNIILGLFFFPTEILPLILTQKLVLLFQENLMSISNSSWASLIDLYKNGEHERFEKILYTLTRVSNFLAISLLSPLIFLNENFIQLWVGKEFYFGLTFTILISINAYFRSNFSIWNLCLTGNGNNKTQVKIELLNALVNLSISLAFIPKLKLLSPTIGTLSSLIFVYLLFIPIALKNHLNLNIEKLLKSVLTPLLFSIPLFFINMYIKRFLISDQWLNFALSYFILFFVNSSIIYYIGFNRDEKKYFINIIKSKLGTIN